MPNGAKVNKEANLSAGDIIKAQILDINPNEITIMLLNNEIIKARVSGNLMLSIGKMAEFIVKSADENTLLLSLKSTPVEVVNESTITDALSSLGLKPDEKNTKLATLLIGKGLTLTKENVANLNKAILLQGGEITETTTKKAFFLMENEIKINSKNVSILNEFSKGEMNLKNIVENLVKEVMELPQTVKQEILNVVLKGDIAPKLGQKIDFRTLLEPIYSLTEDNALPLEVKEKVKILFEKLEIAQKSDDDAVTKEKDILKIIKDFCLDFGDLPIKSKKGKVSKEEILNSLKFNFSKADKKDIDSFLNDFSEKIVKAKSLIGDSFDENYTKVFKSLEKIEDSLKFCSSAKQDVFAQIPLAWNDKQINSEIYLFKDKNKKKQSNDLASALISLNTLNLGKFEVFVQKESKNIFCEFRVEEESLKSFVASNIEQLNNLLKEKGYILSRPNYKTMEEPFSVIQKDLENNNFLDKKSSLIFDMRT